MKKMLIQAPETSVCEYMSKVFLKVSIVIKNAKHLNTKYWLDRYLHLNILIFFLNFVNSDILV